MKDEKVMENKKTLASMFPELAKEWDYELNGTGVLGSHPALAFAQTVRFVGII